MRRVVITGMGAITPLGLNVEEFWNGLKEGRHGFGEITRFDASEYKAHLAGEVKGFVGKEFMDAKAAKRMELFCQHAVAATKEAIEEAGLDMEKEDAYRVGCSVGSGIGSLQAMEREHTRLLEKGPNRINPLLVPMMISNMAAGNVSIQFGLKGKSLNVVTAQATGTNCIGEAYRSIQFGDADVMVAGGTEAAISPIGIGGFAALTALSKSTNPDRCSIPFDKERDGFVMERALNCRIGRIGTCEKTWCKDFSRSRGIWSNQRCLSYHFSGRRWRRCCKCNGKCHQGSKNSARRGYLYQRTWNKYPSQ